MSAIDWRLLYHWMELIFVTFTRISGIIWIQRKHPRQTKRAEQDPNNALAGNLEKYSSRAPFL